MSGAGLLEDDDGLVRRIAALMDLRVDGWHDLGGGFTTNLALEVSAHALVARIHPPTTSRARVEAQQAARRALARAGVPAVGPLALLDLPDGRHVELEPFVDAPDPMKTPERLLAGARVLARLHDALRTADLPAAAHTVGYSNHVPAADAVAVTDEAVEQLLAEHPEPFGRFAAELREHVRAVGAPEAEFAGDQVVVVTHGDFWDRNVLLERGEVAAVLDFGFMADRPRVDDLALPFWFWLLEPGCGLPTADDVDLLARFAEAYDAAAQQPLSSAERASLPPRTGTAAGVGRPAVGRRPEAGRAAGARLQGHC